MVGPSFCADRGLCVVCFWHVQGLGKDVVGRLGFWPGLVSC